MSRPLIVCTTLLLILFIIVSVASSSITVGHLHQGDTPLEGQTTSNDLEKSTENEFSSQKETTETNDAPPADEAGFFDLVFFRQRRRLLCPESQKKSKLTTFLLSFFLGRLGVDRFYTGYVVVGVVKLLTSGLLGIWWLYDFIVVLTGDFIEYSGCPLKNDM